MKKKSEMSLKAFVLDFPLVGNIYARFSIDRTLCHLPDPTQMVLKLIGKVLMNNVILLIA